MAKKAVASDELNALNAEAAKSSAGLAAAEAEKTELEAKIVHVDPERTATLKLLTQRCADAQKRLDEATAETRDVEARAAGMKDLARDIAKTTEYMEEVVLAHRKKKEASTKAKDAKKKLAAMEERQYEIEAKVETLKRQEANCAEKLNRLKSQGELKRHAAEASLKAAKEELEAVKARKEANTARSAEENNQLQLLRRQMREAQETHAVEVEALLKNFASLREQVSRYHAQLADAMDVPEKQRVPLAVVERDANGEFTHTYNWTNYDTVHFGGIGKGRPSVAPGAAGAP